jgi:hypothetical protein
MVKILPTTLITIAIIFISIGIVLAFGIAKVDTNQPQINEDSIIDPPSDSTASITSEVVQLQPESTSSTLKISGLALTCSLINSERIVDLRIENYEEVTKSITISPVGKKVTLLPKQIMRIDIPITDGIKNFILYSDEKEEGSVLVPPCSTEGYSSEGKNSLKFDAAFPSGTQIEPPTGTVPAEDPVTSIPEFPSIALPVLSLIAIMFIMQKRK